MENKIRKFVFNFWPYLVFLALTLISLGFLIIQKGIWAFADSGFYYPTLKQAYEMMMSKLGLFASTDGFYFGYDNSVMAFPHLLISIYQFVLSYLFTPIFGQIIFYFLYYFLSFYFGQKLLKKIMPEAGEIGLWLGGLFLAFNPFALLLGTLFAVSYIYPSFIVFLLAALNYFESGKIKYLTFAAIFGVYLLTYLRLIPIIILTLVFLGLIFFEKIKLNRHRLGIFILTIFLIISPFLVSTLPSILNSQNVVVNYQEAFQKFEWANYNFKDSFINAFSNPGGFTPSVLSFYYNPQGLPGFADNYADKNAFDFFKIIQIIFKIGILLYALAFFRDKRNLIIVISLLILFFINNLGYFLNFDLFLKWHRSIFGFLYNDYGFLQFIETFLYAILIVNLFILVKSQEKKNITYLSVIILLYLILNSLPFLSNHYGFKKVSQIPQVYQKNFFVQNDEDFSEASLFSPYHWLKFDWAPYFLNLNSFFNPPYKSLIMPNLRLVNFEFVNFYNQIYDQLDQDNASNLAIFNLKNIFTFADIETANTYIDNYQVINPEYKRDLVEKKLLARTDLTVAEKNDHYIQFRLNQADDYNFLLYSPKNIFNLTLEDFYQQNLPLSAKPIVLNRSIVNNFNLIGDINFFVNSPYVLVKASPKNPQKYFLKLTVNKKSPFLLQFNQTFSPSWGVYFISRADWEKQNCLNQWQNFSLTENGFCRIQGSTFDLNDLGLINQPELKNENHFVGNFIGNAFLINPSDIPLEFSSGDELYLVIYFKKQLAYLISLIISVLTLIILILLSLIQARKERKNFYL